MSLEKYKICPMCGRHNPPSLMECRECETDLTGVKPVDESNDTPNNIPAPVQENSTVRICECGAHNLPQARKCSVCGEDISDILPVQLPGTASDAVILVLTSVDGGFSVNVTESETVIGREAFLKDYLSDKPYVSRRHAKLIFAPEGAFIKNLSETNRTFLNNILLESETPAELHTGDEIGLGGIVIDGSRQEKAAYFICEVKR